MTPTDHQIVMAMIDGDFTVKRFRKYRDKIIQEAANPDFPSILIGENQELVIRGAVTCINPKNAIEVGGLHQIRRSVFPRAEMSEDLIWNSAVTYAKQRPG